MRFHEPHHKTTNVGVGEDFIPKVEGAAGQHPRRFHIADSSSQLAKDDIFLAPGNQQETVTTGSIGWRVVLKHSKKLITKTNNQTCAR
ncbi:hypothetical protein SAY86_004101 [Trapa natans]|uniref:Uncharacterized protein n=1 Tax=Trapa natans TaxID=22666 RepID=A0AAN7MFB5_TRANT|nr:hypothetical protein SAY86_004101 [Trapa natans]